MLLGDWARAQKARRHKRPEASSLHRPSQLAPHCFSNPHLWPELLAGSALPWGTYKPVSHPCPWAGTRPPCTDSAPGRGGSLFILAATWGRQPKVGAGINNFLQEALRGVLRAGAHTALESELEWFKYLPMVRTRYLTTDPAASISKMWKLKS